MQWSFHNGLSVVEEALEIAGVMHTQFLWLFIVASSEPELLCRVFPYCGDDLSAPVAEVATKNWHHDKRDPEILGAAPNAPLGCC